ncbi:S8 family serine peptidase [Bacillus inaquosorum]|uniref:S8 family serine peptidase n=1 Tax=Bacillus inaquosorum TaxID=483913 RepID=A0A9Q4HZZ8_9BACI|nr:S8 family serine peptidase [Bacillus inaquosorum]MCY7787747.1 S8 family serine peptidase [Bacillus inaquosorum]MCY7820424.1 S8 family serine peptidase [Bacillus inaquosorum]MCY7940317.1 S8 family serine peptidase [Bacillus inaquosorum]MCY8083431.1 S8 family serine peptidase [Bacillus inaquosorum]MCY8162717.1 S8 family serine peptidase [Bacillus inaquosorum]
MKNTFCKLVVSVTLFFSFLALGPLAHAENSSQNEIIVVYKNKDGKETVLDSDAEVEQQYKHLPAVALKADQKTVKEFKQDPDILYVENNVTFTAADNTDLKILSEDADTSDNFEQWNLEPIQVKQAWEEGLTGKNVKIAVIDSGISPHDDLSIAGGFSAVSYTSSYKDDNGHGTHVAGIIGAKHNGYGIDGIAPEAQIYAVKALDQNGSGDLQGLLQGIDWSIANGMDIVNMSLGTTSDSQILHDAVDKAYEQGVLLVAASGNDGNGKPVNYPAAYSSVVAVSATNEKNQLASFSTTGDEVEFSAPGTNITSTYLNQFYATGSGTSQATPHAAAMFALLKQRDPAETNVQLRADMQKNIVDLGTTGRDQQFGYGFIQYKAQATDSAYAAAEQAVKKAEQTKTQTDINKARELVSQLPNSDAKTALQKRLDKIQSYRNVKDAKDKVVKAEKYKTQQTVDTAQTAINKLPNGTDKKNLQKRLDQVKRYIASKQAKEKVAKAEKSKKKSDVDSAQSAVSKLPAGSEKTSLQKRLTKVKSTNLKTAQQSVAAAEKKSTNANTTKAQSAVNQLQSGKDKTSLQKRLDKVKKKAAAAEAKKVETAKAKVKKAEKDKTKQAKASAQSAVNQLQASNEKTKLQKRLNAVKPKK